MIETSYAKPEHLIGLGTGGLTQEIARTAVSYALQNDYKLIDTAARYKNETGVGQGIIDSDVEREQFEVITKGPHDSEEQGYDNTRRIFDASLSALKLDHIDYYLMHWPTGDKESRKGTWQAMEDIQKEERIKKIGVSNFRIEDIEELLEYAAVKPYINQIEFHVGLFKPQQALVDFCLNRDIEVQGYATFANGRYDKIKKNSTLSVISERHNKSIRQVMARFSYQHGVTPLVRSSNPERIASNRQIDDFELTKEEMQALGDLEGERLFKGPRNILS